MADFINWAGISSVGLLAAGRDPGQPGDTAGSGVWMDSTQHMLVTTAPVGPDDNFVNGIAISPDGALRISLPG